MKNGSLPFAGPLVVHASRLVRASVAQLCGQLSGFLSLESGLAHEDNRMMAAAVAPVAHQSVEMARMLLGTATAGGADARQLARDARLPVWALSAGQVMIPSRYSMRLWELVEHALNDSPVALTVTARHQLGDLDLYDYLFNTSATLRDGFAAQVRYLHLITTSSRLQIEADTGRHTTYSYYLEPGGRGEELCLQFIVAMACARAQAATGRPIIPAHIAFEQAAPRSHRVFIDAFGTRRIDFGAPATTFTFHARDLDLPLPGADPVLARILHRYAATMPPRPPATWHEHFQHVLTEAIEQGGPSLEAVARRLAVSPRTLQRRLAERRTTWRAELDTARQRRARLDRHNGVPNMTRLAHRLGYAGPRSARRALRRWDNTAGQ